MGRILGIIGVACAVWVIYDVWMNKKGMTDTLKLIWTVAAVCFSVVTAIIYYVLYFTSNRSS